MPLTDEQLDLRLAAIKHPSPKIEERISRQLIAEASVQKRKRRRSLTSVLTAGLVTIALAIPTAAVAEKLFDAQTGLFGLPGMTETLEGDEFIDNSYDDFPNLVAHLAPKHLPTPNSFNWDNAISEAVNGWRANGHAQMQRIAIINNLEYKIMAAWVDEWMEAYHSADQHRMNTAFNALYESPNWDGMIASDGGGVRFITWSLLNLVAEGDYEAAQTLAQTIQASSWDGSERGNLMATHHDHWFELIGSPNVIDIRDPEFQRLNQQALDQVSGGTAR